MDPFFGACFCRQSVRKRHTGSWRDTGVNWDQEQLSFGISLYWSHLGSSAWSARCLQHPLCPEALRTPEGPSWVPCCSKPAPGLVLRLLWKLWRHLSGLAEIHILRLYFSLADSEKCPQAAVSALQEMVTVGRKSKVKAQPYNFMVEGSGRHLVMRCSVL